MKRKILSALAALAALAFASCSSFNNDEQAEEITGTNAYVKISLADSSRMALPAVSNAGDFTRFTLTGTSSTANAAPISETSWETSGTETAYAKMTAANITVTVGASYTFTLTAEKGGAKWLGSTAKTIAQGANTLSFALELASISTVGRGSLSITLTVPDVVKAVDAALKNPVETSTLTSEGASLSIAESKAVYTRSGIASGNYVLVFTLYGDTAKTLKLGEWREYAGIADGLTSSSSPEIAGKDDLSSIYEINLTYNGGTLSGTVPGSYTRFSSTITLPTASGISRANYDFEGWFDAQTGGNKVETIPAGSSGNKTLYARWTPDANLRAANAVITKINAIGTVEYTDASKALIDAAREAYNALTSDQKALVTNYSTLTTAESSYESLAPVPVTAITLNKTATEIQFGSTETLSVTAVAPDNATDKTYTWKTSDESKATVDQDGKVTAVAAGTVTIYAEANDGSGVKGNCTVTVPPTITVTWNNDDITGSGNSFTKDGVTITAGGIDYEHKNFLEGGTFTTTLGKFTMIEVTTKFWQASGTGWSGSTWTGNASSVSFSGDIYGVGAGNTKFVFTIELKTAADNQAEEETGPTTVLSGALVDGAIIKVNFKWHGSNRGDYVQGVYNAASGTFTVSKGGDYWGRNDGRAVYKVEKSGDNIIIGAGFYEYDMEGMVWTFNTTNDTYTTTNGNIVNDMPEMFGLISVTLNGTDITSQLTNQ